jgi:hypothetical protein
MAMLLALKGDVDEDGDDDPSDKRDNNVIWDMLFFFFGLVLLEEEADVVSVVFKSFDGEDPFCKIFRANARCSGSISSNQSMMKKGLGARMELLLLLSAEDEDDVVELLREEDSEDVGEP